MPLCGCGHRIENPAGGISPAQRYRRIAQAQFKAQKSTSLINKDPSPPEHRVGLRHRPAHFRPSFTVGLLALVLGVAMAGSLLALLLISIRLVGRIAT